MKSPSLHQLRLGIFICWIAFAVLLSLLPFGFLFTSHYPRDVSSGIARSIALNLTSLWFPALGCLAGYWFGATESKSRPNRKRDTKWVVMIITATSLLGILFFVGITLFTHDFGRMAGNLPTAERPLETEISDLLTTLHYFSPLYYAPITFLTGKAIGENSRSEKTEAVRSKTTD